jgi:hypothetical protein
VDVEWLDQFLSDDWTITNGSNRPNAAAVTKMDELPGQAAHAVLLRRGLYVMDCLLEFS